MSCTRKDFWCLQSRSDRHPLCTTGECLSSQWTSTAAPNKRSEANRRKGASSSCQHLIQSSTRNFALNYPKLHQFTHNSHYALIILLHNSRRYFNSDNRASWELMNCCNSNRRASLRASEVASKVSPKVFLTKYDETYEPANQMCIPLSRGPQQVTIP